MSKYKCNALVFISPVKIKHTLILWVSWSVLIFVMVGQFLALWRTKTLERGVLLELPSQWKVFRTFFVHVVRYQFETWHIHPVGGVTRQIRVSFQSGHFDLLYSQNRSKSFICIHGFKNYIEASDLVHTLYSECLYPYWLLSCLGNFWPSGGVNRAPSQWHMRFEFHQNQVSASEEFSGLFSKCCVVSTWKLVYTLSRLHNMSSSCFTRMGSLWPSCS